jgi:hypothetical protein
MPRAPTTTTRIDKAADDKLIAVAKRLGVSKASLLAGFAAWAESSRMPSGKTPVDLHKAIADADRDAVKRQADGAYRGSLARGAQITANGGPRQNRQSAR